MNYLKQVPNDQRKDNHDSREDNNIAASFFRPSYHLTGEKKQSLKNPPHQDDVGDEPSPPHF